MWLPDRPLSQAMTKEKPKIPSTNNDALLPIRRITRMALLGIEQAQHCRSFQHAIGAARAGLIEVRGMREHIFAGHDELGARGHGIDLRAAGYFELVHRIEGLLDGRSAGEEPVVAHDERIVRAEILDDAL